MAVTLEYGKCAECGENNPKSLQACRSCGAALPWAKAPKVAQSSGSAELSVPPWLVQIIGCIVVAVGGFLWLGNKFGFFPTFPFAGYLTIITGLAIISWGTSMVTL